MRWLISLLLSLFLVPATAPGVPSATTAGAPPIAIRSVAPDIPQVDPAGALLRQPTATRDEPSGAAIEQSVAPAAVEPSSGSVTIAPADSPSEFEQLFGTTVDPPPDGPARVAPVVGPDSPREARNSSGRPMEQAIAGLARPARPDADQVPRTAARAGRFGWPLRPRPAVLRRFDKPAHDWLPGHRGVDLAAVVGQAVLAAGAGTVAFAGQVGGMPVVSIDHPGGLRTTYEPVRPSVSAGQVVARGSPIGTLAVGDHGCITDCLHWGARRDHDYVDPLGLLHLSRLRLKPMGGIT